MPVTVPALPIEHRVSSAYNKGGPRSFCGLPSSVRVLVRSVDDFTISFFCLPCDDSEDISSIPSLLMSLAYAFYVRTLGSTYLPPNCDYLFLFH